MLYKLARYLPGIGGPAGLDELTPADALELLATLKRDLEAEAAAIRSAKR